MPEMQSMLRAKLNQILQEKEKQICNPMTTSYSSA